MSISNGSRELFLSGVYKKETVIFCYRYITFNLPSFLLSSSDTFGHFSSYVVPASNAWLNAFNEEVKIKSLSSICLFSIYNLPIIQRLNGGQSSTGSFVFNYVLG